MNRISIIVPVYNGEKTIERCINSLLKQTYKKFEIIIINDASTDNTKKKLSIFKNFSNISIVNLTENVGASIARNIGINLAKTEYVAFVDSDDWVRKNYLQDLLKGFEVSPEIDLSVIGVKEQNRKSKYTYSNYKSSVQTNSEMIDDIYNSSGPKGYLWNKLWKLSIIKDNHIMLNSKVDLGEDLIFNIQYLLFCDKVYLSNKYDYIYEYSVQGLSKKRDAMTFYLSLIKASNLILEIFEKNGKKDLCTSTYVYLGLLYFHLFRVLKKSKIKNEQQKICIKNMKNYKRWVFKSKNLNLKTKIGYAMFTLI